MRRVFGLILLGLGVFAVAIAVLLPYYVYPKVAKVPLDQSSTSVLEGTAERVLAVTNNTAAIRTNAQLTATAKVQANFDRAEMKSGTDVAVWLLAVQVVDNSDNTTVSASKRQVCFDRQTAEGSRVEEKQTDGNCQYESTFVAELDEDVKVDPGKAPPEKLVFGPQPGLQFKFPFGTEKKEYQVYQDSVRRAVPAKFTGTDQVNGVDVYKFEQNVDDTQIDRRTVPGSLVGRPEQSLEMQLYYRGTVSMWVEPVTGVIVKQSQYQHQELRVPSNSTGTVVFDGTLTYSDATTKTLIDQVNTNKGKLDLITTTGPIWLGIIGGVMILAGAFLLVRDRKAKQAPPGDKPVASHALTR
ncbi:MAG: DUF3068 domain-containing protein [Kibdelosporangium sp.]